MKHQRLVLNSGEMSRVGELAKKMGYDVIEAPRVPCGENPVDPQWLNAPIIPKYSLRALTSTRALNSAWYAKLLTPKND